MKNNSHAQTSQTTSQDMFSTSNMPGPKVGEKRAREASSRSWHYPSSNPMPREEFFGQGLSVSARSWNYPSANPTARVKLDVVKEAHGLAKEAEVTVFPAAKDLLVFKQLVRPKVLEHLRTQPRAFATTFHADVTLQKGSITIPLVIASGAKGKGSLHRVTMDTKLDEVIDQMFAEIGKRLDEWSTNAPSGCQ